MVALLDISSLLTDPESQFSLLPDLVSRANARTGRRRARRSRERRERGALAVREATAVHHAARVDVICTDSLGASSRRGRTGGRRLRGRGHHTGCAAGRYRRRRRLHTGSAARGARSGSRWAAWVRKRRSGVVATRWEASAVHLTAAVDVVYAERQEARGGLWWRRGVCRRFGC